MADLSSISKEICKNRNLEKNLSTYMDSMMTLYSRFSYIKLSMNYYTFCDVVSELDDEISREVVKILASLNGIIDANIVNTSDREETNKALERLNTIRDSITETMDVVTAYVDRLAVFEHILNRVEYKFSDEETDENYYDNQLANDIMHYILSDRDSVVMNGKIAEIIGQLPMRLTRKKFFELVQDAFGLYKGQEKSALNDFVYMLDTVSGIYTPKGFEARFPDLHEILLKLSSCNYKEMTKEEYDKAHEMLSYAVSFVTKTSDLYVQLMEIINDTFIILLARPYAFHDSVETKNCIDIIETVMKTADGSMEEVYEDITDKFISFEGRQERIYSQISSNDYVIDEINQSFLDQIRENGLEDAFESLRKIEKLASGSYFVSLLDNSEGGKVSEEDAGDAFSKYYEKLSGVFKNSEREYNRAVMAMVLSSLPVFFNNLDEIVQYVKTSLEQCTEPSERKATAALIQMLVEEND